MTPEERAWIEEAYLCGDEPDEIATVSGFTVARVRGVLGAKRLTDLQRSTATRYLDGHSFRLIAHQDGVTFQAIEKRLDKVRANGWSLPQRKAEFTMPRRFVKPPTKPVNTQRESAVLALVSTGLSHSEVATQIGAPSRQVINGIVYRFKKRQRRQDDRAAS